AHEAVAREPEDRLGPDLGHEVVVVRVEPLRHLERRILALAARDREVTREIDAALGIRERREAARDRAERDGGVENLVVVRERLGDRGVVAPEPERDESRARRTAQLGGRALELADVDAARPERLDSALELAPTTDAGVAENRAGGERCGHADCSPI